MKVWVIMGNDFPDAVFSDEKAAEKYIAVKKAEALKDREPWQLASRVYWRSYEFTLNQGLS